MYAMTPLSCDPVRIKGMSERLNDDAIKLAHGLRSALDKMANAKS